MILMKLRNYLKFETDCLNDTMKFFVTKVTFNNNLQIVSKK